MARYCSRSMVFTPTSTHTDGSDSFTLMLRGRRVVIAMLALRVAFNKPAALVGAGAAAAVGPAASCSSLLPAKGTAVGSLSAPAGAAVVASGVLLLAPVEAQKKGCRQQRQYGSASSRVAVSPLRFKNPARDCQTLKVLSLLCGSSSCSCPNA